MTGEGGRSFEEFERDVFYGRSPRKIEHFWISAHFRDHQIGVSENAEAQFLLDQLEHSSCSSFLVDQLEQLDHSGCSSFY